MSSPTAMSEAIINATIFFYIHWLSKKKLFFKYKACGSLISKIYKAWELIKDEAKKDKEMDNFLSTSHILDIWNKLSWDYCLPKELIANLASKTKNNDNPSNSNDSNWNTISKIDYGQVLALLSGSEASKSKISLFFDNSLSVERNDVSSQYMQIYNSIKNFDGKPRDIDLFSFSNCLFVFLIFLFTLLVSISGLYSSIADTLSLGGPKV